MLPGGTIHLKRKLFKLDCKVDRCHFDFGPDPVVEAMMYFEGAVYIQTFRKLFNPADFGGEGPKEVSANLMPPELWEAFLQANQ